MMSIFERFICILAAWTAFSLLVSQASCRSSAQTWPAGVLALRWARQLIIIARGRQ